MAKGVYKRKPLSEEHKRNIGLAHLGMKRPSRSAETLKRMSIAHQGKTLSEEAKMKLRIHWQNLTTEQKEEHKRKQKVGLAKNPRSYSNEQRLEHSLRVRRGANHPNWKGGVTTEYKKIRKSIDYKIWRTNVFERDNYICVLCGVHSGNGKRVDLHADHIKPFALFPELRFELSNGRTLCIPCHKKTDTYGSKTNSLRNPHVSHSAFMEN